MAARRTQQQKAASYIGAGVVPPIGGLVPQLAISGTPGAATVGTPYSFTPVVTGGSGAKSFSLSGSLPAGLSFNSSTGAVTGTPTAAATTTFGVSVSDSSGSASLTGLVMVVSAPSAFLAAAQRIVSMSQNKRPITEAPGEISIDISNTGASIINGRSFASGGIVATASIPSGNSPPLNPGVTWIVTKTPANQNAGNLGYAPGQQKLFKFAGQKFDFKAGNGAGLSFTVQWSEDDGLNWKRSGIITITTACWCLIDFGSAKNRIVKIVGEDEQFATYGFNFDTGNAVSAAFDVSAFPKGMVFGDSYMFSQGAKGASWGIGLEAARQLGWHQIYTHGFRQNGFSNTQSGVQSRFADRIKLPTDDSLSEGAHWGALDYALTGASINDDSATYAATRYQDHVDAFINLRQKQPNALILFMIGLRPPNLIVPTYADQKAAFKAVFGNTQAEWIANGAWMIDGSVASGEAWVPAGAIGSSPYFPASGDTNHPNDAGHAFGGAKFAANLIALATAIAGSVVTPTDSLRITSSGDVRVTTDGNTRKVA